jgi:DNA-binding LacI/PurR family transcriptional regulator
MGKKQSKANGTARVPRKTMNLKKLAEHLDLSPATVSLVINRSSVADSVPQENKDRVFAAARKFKYRPNFFARSLRAQHSFTIGVIVPEVSEGYSAAVMSGVEDYLLREGYFYLVANHRHRADLIDEYPRMFRWNTIEFALNDISAMGAIRALRQIGWQVPEDISVVGFDDIQSAAYQNPSLTTVHQPLREMGRAAAEILLKRINRLPVPSCMTGTSSNPSW